MATFYRLSSGQWRAQVRPLGHSVSRTFRLKQEAEDWARDQNGRIHRGDLLIAIELTAEQRLPYQWREGAARRAPSGGPSSGTAPA